MSQKSIHPDLITHLASKELTPAITHNLYLQMMDELFLATHPEIYFAKDEEEKTAALDNHHHRLEQKGPLNEQGTWVHLPWLDTLFHLPSRDDYYHLRTLRNQNLITPFEQTKLHQSTIAIAGLSVGQLTCLSLIHYGIGQTYHLTDTDHVELSNINRTRFDLTNYGQEKLTVTSQLAYQIDPFLQILPFPQGLNEHNLDEFTSDANLIIDAFDTFPIKLKLRQLAKAKKIPILSGVDLEHGILLIIERYDQEPGLTQDLFLNHLDPTALTKPNISKQDITNFFINMIGENLHSPKMLNSVKSVGTKLTSYPQLIVASQLLASALTVATKMILLDEPLPSGRHHLDLPTLISA